MFYVSNASEASVANLGLKLAEINVGVDYSVQSPPAFIAVSLNNDAPLITPVI